MSRRIFYSEPPGNPLPPLWLALAMFLLGVGWLVPNHYYPWISFHTDAWIAVCLMIVAGVIWLRCPGRAVWHQLTVTVALLMLVPPLQHWAGLLPFAGQAWMGLAYMAGLLLALLTGAQWERARAGQVADALFGAIAFAAIVSAGFAFYQWLEIREQEIYILPAIGSRVFANLAQPNQLATLLIWGVLAVAWGVMRGKIRALLALPIVALLLGAVVLTQSRTAWLSLCLAIVAVWVWPPLTRVRGLKWVVLGLGAYFFIFAFSLTAISETLLLGYSQRPLEGESSKLRLHAYQLFVDAIANRPWWGYGWFQLPVAQLAMAQRHPPLEGFFLHSHNLFLDLLLWCGIPVGAMGCAAIVLWVVHAFRNVRDLANALLLMFVLAVGIHAMLELPLHYAYFLLPTGLILGMLNVRLKMPSVVTTARWVPVALGVGASALLLTIIFDYLKVEESFQKFRFEVARIGTQQIGTPPDVLVLTHLRDYIRLARKEIRMDMPAEEVEWVLHVAYTAPSPANLFSITKAYALNGRRSDAQQWIYRMQRVMPSRQFEEIRALWEQHAKETPDMNGFDWPALKARSMNP